MCNYNLTKQETEGWYEHQRIASVKHDFIALNSF